MELEIISPEQKLFSGNVYGIQVPGISGSFEVLNNHAPLISTLSNGSIKILITEKQFENLPIQKGVIEVQPHKTVVLVEQ
ncbi:MAG: ATP synthase F1 subunit epsilon [Alphaproteobacteria bacterium]|nr:ATP synthase F1 subunit epsilon [Alphaproteobacteria bacterium]